MVEWDSSIKDMVLKWSEWAAEWVERWVLLKNLIEFNGILRFNKHRHLFKQIGLENRVRELRCGELDEVEWSDLRMQKVDKEFGGERVWISEIRSEPFEFGMCHWEMSQVCFSTLLLFWWPVSLVPWFPFLQFSRTPDYITIPKLRGIYFSWNQVNPITIPGHKLSRNLYDSFKWRKRGHLSNFRVSLKQIWSFNWYYWMSLGMYFHRFWHGLFFWYYATFFHCVLFILLLLISIII